MDSDLSLSIKGFSDESGKINLVFVVLFAVLAAAVYLGYKFIPPYSDDYSLSHFLEIQTRNAYDWKDEEILKNIKKFAEDNKIPLAQKDYSVYRSGKEITIVVRYKVQVSLPFGMDRVLPFQHQVKAQIKPKKEL